MGWWGSASSSLNCLFKFGWDYYNSCLGRSMYLFRKVQVIVLREGKQAALYFVYFCFSKPARKNWRTGKKLVSPTFVRQLKSPRFIASAPFPKRTQHSQNLTSRVLFILPRTVVPTYWSTLLQLAFYPTYVYNTCRHTHTTFHANYSTSQSNHGEHWGGNVWNLPCIVDDFSTFLFGGQCYETLYLLFFTWS